MKRSKRIILKLILIFLLAFLTNGVVMAASEEITLTTTNSGNNVVLKFDNEIQYITSMQETVPGNPQHEIIYTIKNENGDPIGYIGGIGNNFALYVVNGDMVEQLDYLSAPILPSSKSVDITQILINGETEISIEGAKASIPKTVLSEVGSNGVSSTGGTTNGTGKEEGGLDITQDDYNRAYMLELERPISEYPSTGKPIEGFPHEVLFEITSNDKLLGYIGKNGDNYLLFRVNENGTIDVLDDGNMILPDATEINLGLLRPEGEVEITITGKDESITETLEEEESPSSSLFKSIGELIARFIRTLANGLSFLIHSALRTVSGVTGTVDIDTIIFNHFPDTIVNFFDNSAQSTDAPSNIVDSFKENIVHWYNVFRKIAISGYLIILLYAGVKILFSVGGSQKADYKSILTYWLTGVLILALFPYVIKYAIDMNNTLVKTIEDAKTNELGIPNTTGSVDLSSFQLPSLRSEAEEYYEFSAQMDNNPYASSNSYMGYMASRAEETEGVVEAIVYLIMVWQLLSIIIIYYRRIFMIAFLIVIFPIVALSYALDKIGDHRSQAFDTWTRELMTNIFIQSIHAVVYVFVVGATYSSGAYSGDWILTIMGISFLLQAENILKKIIGQEGETTRSLGDTAKRTMATVAATRTVARHIANNYIGAKSHLGRAMSYYREYRSENFKANNMRFFMGRGGDDDEGNSPRPFNPNLNTPSYDDLRDDVNTINDFRNADPQALGNALNNVMSQLNSNDPNVQSIMKGLNFTDSQLQALSDLQQHVVDTVVDVDRSNPEAYRAMKEQIDQDIDIYLQAIFPAEKDRREMIKRAMYYRLRDGNRDEKHKVRSTKYAEVEKEKEEAIARRLSFSDPLGLWVFKDEATEPELSDKGKSTAQSILATHYKATGVGYKFKDQRMAESIAILKDVSEAAKARGADKRVSQRYTARQVWQAAQYVAEHEGDSKSNRIAIQQNLGGNSGEDVKAMVAEHMARTYVDTSGDRRKFRDEENIRIKVTATDSTEVQRQITEARVNGVMAEVIEYIQANDSRAGQNLHYEESIDRYSVKDVLRRERNINSPEEATQYDDAYLDYLVSMREARNEQEISWVEQFAREQLNEMPEETYEGLTQEEHEEYAANLRAKFVEELARTSATTTGVVLGGLIGTGLAIGVSDDSPILEEALVGAGAGMLAGDALAERAIGREDVTERVSIVNPYTGNVEQFDLKAEGFTKDGIGISMIGKGEVVTIDDPRLMGFKYNLERQFLENKSKGSVPFEKKVSVYNPQTRRVEEIKLTRNGVARDGFRLEDIKKGEVLEANDPRISGFRSEVDSQLMQSATENANRLAQRRNTFRNRLGGN